MEPPQNDPITELGKLGDYWEAPFFGSSRGSGKTWLQVTRFSADLDIGTWYAQSSLEPALDFLGLAKKRSAGGNFLPSGQCRFQLSIPT